MRQGRPPNQDKPNLKSLINSALFFLKRRARSKHEIIVHLQKKTEDWDLIDKTIDYLDENHLIDDRVFAEWVAKSYLNKCKGELLITQKLKQQGVSQDEIANCLEAIEFGEWIDKAVKFLNKKSFKLRALDEVKLKNKANQWLYQRGFGGRVRSAAIDEFLEAE